MRREANQIKHRAICFNRPMLWIGGQGGGVTKMLRKGMKRAALAGCGLAALAGAANAQQSAATLSFERKPPPGYERRALHVGAWTVMPEIRLSAIADSNVFATSANAEEDALFIVEPTLLFERSKEELKLTADAHATIRQYAENTGENINLFGANGRLRYLATPSQSVFAGVGFDRTFQRRDDPERNDDLNLPLTPIANFSADAGYSYRPGRLGIEARAGVVKTDYDEPVDDERDQASYRGSLRALAGLSSRIDAFVEGYAAWRDFRLDVDSTGVDRDGETYGATAGVALDLTDKLTGEIGAGVFRARFDDPTLDEFTGFGASGELTWLPQQRTAVVLNVFRGDVATNRAGASGRVDARASLKVFQELRHNLRARVEIGYRHGEFRGANQTQDDFTGGAAIEFLISRHLAAEAGYTFRNRGATNALDEFTAHHVGLALIARY